MYILLFSCQVMSSSSWPHGLHHARLPCPSPSSGVCPSSCPLHWWCQPTTISMCIHNETDSTVYMENQGSQNIQNNFGKEEQSGKTLTDFKTYYKATTAWPCGRMVLLKGKTCRLMEESWQDLGGYNFRENFWRETERAESDVWSGFSLAGCCWLSSHASEVEVLTSVYTPVEFWGQSWSSWLDKNRGPHTRARISVWKWKG